MNQIEEPLVSVIVPCYNHEKYVEQCIMSIVNQTYKNIQLIVIDDGSKDGSFEVISGLSHKFGFIAEKQTNIGLSKTVNRALKEFAIGEYVVIIASDDYMTLNRIEEQVKFFEQRPDFGFIFSKAEIVNNDGYKIGILPRTQITECSFNTLINVCYVPALSSMVKREVYDKVGYYDEESYIEDWDMWLRISNVYSFGFLDEIHAYYRLHGSNISSNYEKMIYAKKRILQKWSSHSAFAKGMDKILLEELAILSVLDKYKAISFFFKNLYLAKYLSFYKSVFKLFFINKIKTI